jgi:hypothetical protein
MARIEMEGFEEDGDRARLPRRHARGGAGGRARSTRRFAYAIELETFASPTALGSNQPRRGAGFWVTADDLVACADALERGGHLRGLVDRGS